MMCIAGVFNLIILVLLLAAPFNLTAQISAVAGGKIDSVANSQVEKVHLHFDKPFYYAGDTIWFKSYLVDRENKLTEHSKLLYVELIDRADRILKSLKVPLSAGLGWADIPLGKELPGGNYRLRAYTAWMRNFGEGYFFDKVIPVTDILEKQITSVVHYSYKSGQLVADVEYKAVDGSLLSGNEVKYSILVPGKSNISGKGLTDSTGRIQVRIDTAGLTMATLVTDMKAGIDTIVRSFLLPNKEADFDAQFFPEGGLLVNNIPSRLGFKVVGANGLGLKATGYITDNSNARIANFETEFAGMGILALNPQPGQTFTAHIVLESGIEKTFPLPLAAAQGYVMTVTQDENNILVRVRSGNDFQSNQVTLKAVSQGKEYVSSSNSLKDAQLIIRVQKADLPSGITRLTLSSGEGTPLAERLVFVDHSDQLSIQVDSLRDQYLSRSKVTPKLIVTDKSGKPVLAHMSMTVVDESKVPYNEYDETSILSNLLVSSELKGHIEKPNFYFTDKDADKKRQLDILLMTQGWRKFELQAANPIFNPENGLSVKGKVLSPLKAPQPRAEVSLVVQGAAPVFRKVMTNEKGEFAFDTLYFENTARLAISAKNAKGSSNVNILLDTILPQAVPALTSYNAEDLNKLDGLIMSNLDDDNLNYLKKYSELNKTQQLAEVVVRGAKARLVPNSTNLTGRDAMYTFLEKDLLNYTNLSDVVRAKVPGITTSRTQAGETVAMMQRKKQASISGPMFMQVYLDGVPVGNDLDQYNLNDFDAVEVLNRDTEFAPYGTLGAGGVILLTTRASGPKSSQPMGNIRVNAVGYAPDRQFYSPKYESPVAGSQGRDARSTIYWNPNILISNGLNTDVSFYTADSPGSYRFIIEGVDEFGRLGRKVFTKNINPQAGQVFGKTSPVQKKPVSAEPGSKTEVIEKVHLHFDRPFYSAGDTIWFKAYLVESGTRLTKHSAVLYVELLSDTDQIIESIKIPLSAGLGWANFNLSENLPGGNYRVRAYTNWMRNYGDEGFFNKIIPVSDIFESQIASTVKYNYSGPQFIADLEYKDMEGKPLAARDVRYMIPREGKRTISGKGKTDMNGHLQIRIDTTDFGNARNLQAGLNIEKDTIFKSFEIPINALGFDAQFFPEGGSMVNNVPGRIGFKIIGAGGLGLQASGYVADEANVKVADFKTEFAGMGAFDLNPQAGKTYTAYISLKNGVGSKVLLPKPLDQGLVMTITQDSKDVIATVKASPGFGSGSNIQLTVKSQGNTTVNSRNVLSGQVFAIKVPKADLPAGISSFTLIKDSQPVAERVVFIDQPESLIIDFDSLRSSYSTTSKVVPGIRSSTSAGKPATAHFSLAVVDDNKVPYDESDELTVFSNLLLSSELRGYIEKSNYYFTEPNDDKKRHLDNLMLTQGWRKFEPSTAKFQAETGLAVKGKLLTPLKTPVPNAPVMLMIQREGEGFRNTLTNANGEFVFDSLYFQNRVKMILSATNSTGKGNVAIKIDSVSGAAPVTSLMYNRPNFLAAIDSTIYARKEDAYLEQMNYHVNLNKVQQLAEVRVVATRRQPYHPSLMAAAPFTYDQKVLLKYPSLGLALAIEGVPGLIVDGMGTPSFYGRAGKTNAVIMLDNVQIDAFEFSTLEPHNIEAVEVLNSPRTATREGPVGPRILITTRKGGMIRKSPELGQLDYFAQGFQPERQFYSPRYDKPKETQLSDLRTTIYWNPDILTLNGKGPSIDFFTAAKPGKYRFIIEGIDTEGRLGRRVLVKEIK